MYLKPDIYRIIPKWRSKSSVGTVLSSSASNIWILLGVGLVFLYVMRVSVLSLWAGPFVPLLQRGGQGLLIVGIILLIAKGGRAYSALGIVFITMTLPSVLMSANISQAMLKWTGWAVIFAIAGPLILGNKAHTFRQASWSAFRWTFISIAIASFGWYFAGLPNLGRGAFTGVMMHSMLLGPIAAMASLFLVHRAIVTRSRLCLFFSLLAFIPCLLAGSRTALLGLAAGALVMVVFSVGRAGLSKSIATILVAGLFVVLGFLLLEDVKDKQYVYRYTLELEKKGLNNSRKSLWAARLSEFRGSPLVGVGVGMGNVITSTREWKGVVVDASGNINIEPGSSYLAVLSMTGILGALGLCFVLGSILRRLIISKKIKIFDPELFEVLSLCAFFAVHLAAEGYIFAVGNQFCLLFWLCLGRLYDLVSLRGKKHSPAYFPSSYRQTNNGVQCLK